MALASRLQELAGQKKSKPWVRSSITANLKGLRAFFIRQVKQRSASPFLALVRLFSTRKAAPIPSRSVSRRQVAVESRQVRAGVGLSRGTGTFTQVGPKEVDGLPFLAETVRGELQGDFELADGSVAPDGATLEIPSPGTNVSGIGLISGWSCLGGELAVGIQ